MKRVELAMSENVLLDPCSSASICRKSTWVWEHISAPGSKLAFSTTLCTRPLVKIYSVVHVAREIKLEVCVNSEPALAALVCHMLLLGRVGFQPSNQAPRGDFHCLSAALVRGFVWSCCSWTQMRSEHCQGGLNSFHDLTVLNSAALRDLFTSVFVHSLGPKFYILTFQGGREEPQY